jgi:hypothetical protein
MDKVVPTDQSPKDLILNIIRGSIKSEAHFRVFGTGFIECPDLFVRAEIIGASHVIHFSYKKVELCEVFACLHMALPGMDVIHKSIGECCDKTITLQLGPVDYHIATQIKNWARGEPLINELEDRISSSQMQENEIGLVYEFPKVNLEPGSEHGPKTIVHVTTDRLSQVRVETIHGYPNKDSVVFTNATFDF